MYLLMVSKRLDGVRTFVVNKKKGAIHTLYSMISCTVGAISECIFSKKVFLFLFFFLSETLVLDGHDLAVFGRRV